MKYIFLILFSASIASASILGPVMKCTIKEESFSFIIEDASYGKVVLKNATCPIVISNLELIKGRVGRDQVSLDFEIENCHPELFYNRGFLKIEDNVTKGANQAYILALKGSQTKICEVSLADLKKVIKLISKENQLPLGQE